MRSLLCEHQELPGLKPVVVGFPVNAAGSIPFVPHTVSSMLFAVIKTNGTLLRRRGSNPSTLDGLLKHFSDENDHNCLT